MLYKGETKEELEIKVQDDLKIYLDWLKGQKLVMNTSKTRYMVLCPKRKIDIDVILKVQDYQLTRVKYTKYLGEILDEELSLTQHVNSIVKKITPIISI